VTESPNTPIVLLNYYAWKSRLAFQISRTIQSPDADTVHDLRVAIRRFTQVLVVWKPCFAPKKTKAIRRRLKSIMAVAGEVRNCDIAAKLLSKLDRAAAGLAPRFLTRRRVAERMLVRSLKRSTARSLPAEWRTELAAGNGDSALTRDPLEDNATRTLRGLAKAFLDSGEEAASVGASPAKMHEFRLAAKRFRYSLELFAPLYGPPVHGWLEQIKTVQTLLGAINDCETVRSMVAAYEGGEKVVSALKKRQQKHTAQFRRRWAEMFSQPSTMQNWMAALNHFETRQRPARKPISRAGAHTGRHGSAAVA